MISSMIFSGFSILCIFILKTEDKEIFTDKLYFNVNDQGYFAVKITLFVFSIINSVLFLLDSNLVCFHIYLQKK